MAVKRKAIGKKKRFEVFKRDSFTCQYCGDAAPDVILHIDHIKPVANGGNNGITNLVTSCIDCNQGKGARELSDDSVAKKQHKQLAEIQERRNQLELIQKWHCELQAARSQEEVIICDAFDSECSGLNLSELGRKKLIKVMMRFGLVRALEAVAIASYSYMELDSDGINTSKESVSLALNKVGGICYNKSRLTGQGGK